MKKLLTLVITAALTLAVGAITYAQDAGPQGGQIESRQHHGGGGGLKMMMQVQHDVLAGMHLSDEKMKKIEALNKSTVDEMKAFKKSNKDNADKDAMREKHKAMMKKYHDSMRDILGSDWKTYRQQMEAKMKELRAKQKDKP